MKLNYSFSKREIALILVLVLVLVGLLYYRFVYLGISNQIEQYNTADLEAEIQMEQLQLIEWQKMQDEISVGTVSTSSLETYDNQKREINLLNDIFEPVIRYNFSFEKPVATGDTVRRNVSVSFTTIDYNSALTIIAQLHDSKYRVLLKDIKISPGDLTSAYLSALANEALTDRAALTQLRKQVATLLESGLPVDTFVMKVYKGEPITEASSEENAAQEPVPAADGQGQENPAETLPEGSAADGQNGQDGIVITDADGTAAGNVPEGGTYETLEDGTVVAPQPGSLTAQSAAESESESETETEEPVQTMANSIVNVSLTMTFYETAYGAESLDGLIIQTPETNAPAA